ncbi:hypothetical protein JCM10207_003436 [Rhodosporidiobolus poonsookiae]
MAWLNALLFCLPTTQPSRPALASTPHPKSSSSTSLPAPASGPAAPVPQTVISAEAQSSPPQYGRSDEMSLRKRQFEEWEKDYASGKYDIEAIQPPPFYPKYPSPSENQPTDHSLFPPYSPQQPPYAEARQRTVDKLEYGTDRPRLAKPTSPHNSPPQRPRKSSRRPSVLSLRPESHPAHLPTPPLTPQGRRQPSKSVLSDTSSQSVLPSASPHSSSSKASIPSPPPLSSTNSDTSSLPALAAAKFSQPLIRHPFCRELVSSLSEHFDTSAAMVSLLDDDKLVFLAASGVEQDAESLPLQASFCTHTVLNGDRGFVVLDASKDFRFANNYLTVEKGLRFYAGAPIFASTDLRNPASARLPIGTLCLTDTTPHAQFPTVERQKLLDLAALASAGIEAWAQARLTATATYLDETFERWKQTLPSPSRTSTFSSSTPTASTPRTSVAASVHSPSAENKKLSIPTTDAELPRPLHQLVDLATQTIGTTLDVPLTYLLSLSPSPTPPSSSSPYPPVPAYHLSLVSSFSPPAAEASSPTLASPSSSRILRAPPLDPLGFNVDLHLSALEAAEGGILYENTTSAASKPGAFAGGILLALRPPAGAGAQRAQGEGGVVLAVFKRDPKRVWGKEELAVLRRFAEKLAEYVA